jgi:hypothetical protein
MIETHPRFVRIFPPPTFALPSIPFVNVCRASPTPIATTSFTNTCIFSLGIGINSSLHGILLLLSHGAILTSHFFHCSHHLSMCGTKLPSVLPLFSLSFTPSSTVGLATDTFSNGYSWMATFPLLSGSEWSSLFRTSVLPPNCLNSKCTLSSFSTDSQTSVLPRTPTALPLLLCVAAT